MSVPYRRIADLEYPVLWLNNINENRNLGYHNEVSFYRSQVKNLRMKSYFDLAFELTRQMINQQMAVHHPHRCADVKNAQSPDELVSIAKGFIPTQIATTVPSTVSPGVQFEGGTIVLSQMPYGGAALYMNLPTTHSKTKDFDKEMTQLMVRLISSVKKLNNKSYDTENIIASMMTITYYFFNLCPLSRGSASVGFATLLGMLLSVNQEITSHLPHGKILDMEATLSGGPDVFIAGTKDWLKSRKTETPITKLPLVKDVFPTVRSLMEVLAIEDYDC